VTAVRWPRPWRSLRGRLALGFIVGLVVSSAIFTIVGSSLIRTESTRTAREEFDRQAEAVGALVSRQAQRLLPRAQCYSFRVQNLEALAGRGTQIFYVGLPLCPGSTTRATFGLPKVASAQISQQELLAKGVQRIDFTLPSTGARREASAAPIIVGGAPFGAVVLARPPGTFGSAFPDVLTRVALAAGIGLVVALVVVIWVTRRATRPLREMERATAQVARGDMRIAVSGGGARELEELAASFNEMVRQLAQRDAVSRDFLMRVTHDLRTPLTAIRGHAAALADGIVPEEETPRSLAAIESEAARLETLVSDLLDMAKLDAHRFRLDLAEVDARELLESAFDAFGSEAARRGVSYERRVAPLAPLVTDGARVRQIVANLLENALRWTPPGGRVELDAGPRARGGLVVTVSDTGPGVPQADREAIFEPFRSSVTPDGRHGSGLGLAISRQLARALGGDLTLTCGEGGGSAFTLRLPARSEQESPALVG
jgi:two-component system sensor histidine kinase BaeS